ncbi:MAG TPA: hypothetical protein VNV35_13120, partial [Puia sp.]|nr:hypothetical protein [Puia sp.]
MNKKFLISIRCLLILPIVSFVHGPRPLYKDPHLSVDRRVEDLLSRMTVEEKIRQLDMYWGKEVAEMDGPNLNGHEASAWSEQKTAASLGNAGAGSVHDLYPLTAAITNS